MRKLFLLALLFVSGCTTFSSTPTTSPSEFVQWEAHKAHLSALNHWQMDSRIFIQAKKEGFSSSVRWLQHDESYQLRFSAPFGQGQYILNGQPDKVSILLPDNSEQTAKDPESLMQKALGFKLPVSGLGYWLRGLPYPVDPERDLILDSNERLSKLKQAGWEISISKYVHKDGYYLPTKLIMENRHLKIKMAVKQWDVSTLTK